jgi:small conductance mechanosensitive channel
MSAADSLKQEVKQPIDQITDKLDTWWDTFINMIPNMIVSVLLFLLFIGIAKIAQRVVTKIFKRYSHNEALRNLISTITYYAFVGLGLFVILGILKLEKAVTSLLAGVGVIGLALGFAFQDIAANFVSGIILAFRTPFHIGDVVEINGYTGTITRTNLRVTVLQTWQGQEVYLPNKDVLSNPITNYSILGQRRIDLAVGISYGDDLKKIEEMVLKAFKEMEGVIRHDDMIFTYKEFGDSSINFEIKFWIDFPGDYGYLGMRSKAVTTIKSIFDKEGITIPFPIRTLDFGIKGGEKLSEMEINTKN